MGDSREAAERLGRPVGAGVDGIEVGGVDRAGWHPEFAAKCLQLGRITPGEKHAAAGCHHDPRECRPDAAGATEDQDT